MSPPSHRFGFQAIILGLLLAMASCASVVAAAELPTRIAFPSGMNGQIVVTMDKANIAKANGLNAQFLPFQYGPPMMEALAAGSLDIVVTSMMPVASYASKIPGDIKVVAIVNTSSHALMVEKDSDITGPAALAGKKIGVSFGSDSHLDTLIWLRESGLTGKMSLINVQPGDLATSLSNKSVDAIVIRQPQVLRLQQQSGAKIIKSWSLDYISIAKVKFITEHPEELKKYLSALRDSAFFMVKNPQQSAAWFADYLRTDPAIIEEVAKEDPRHSVTDIAQIDLSVKSADRQMIETKLREAYAEKLIRERVDPELLLP